MEAEGTEAPGIFKGAPVIVRGLRSAPEHNGARGTVTSGLWDNGRYEVTLPREPAGEPRVLALKPANLELDTEALQEYVLRKRAEASSRGSALEDVALVWAKGKGLSSKAVSSRKAEVRGLQQGEVLLRVDKFAFGHMAMGYLMKGFTRSFGAYHNFYRHPEDGLYRSGCWGFATVLESRHPKVAVGTRLYGLLPPCRFQVMPVGGIIPPGKNGEPAVVEVTMEGLPYNMSRFQELQVVDSCASDAHLEDWKAVTKELYTMAFYMDEQLLVDTGMINSVLISCASSKTALALAYCLRMRDMRLVVGLTSQEHLGFVRSTDLFHEVYAYEEVASVPNSSTTVYMDFRCDGQLRRDICQRMGTNLMYAMVVGPAVFQRKLKDQLFEGQKSREVLFDESSWRARRKMVAEVTKTDRNERLRYSQTAFIERLQRFVRLRYVSGVGALVKIYDALYNNEASPADAYVCTLHEGEFEGEEELWNE